VVFRAYTKRGQLVSGTMMGLTCFQRLIALNRAIVSTKFPLHFVLSRYAGLDPEKQAEADTRGLEFVPFDNRMVLKVTGNYNAADNADRLTPNQRASRALQEVIVPSSGRDHSGAHQLRPDTGAVLGPRAGEPAGADRAPGGSRPAGSKRLGVKSISPSGLAPA